MISDLTLASNTFLLNLRTPSTTYMPETKETPMELDTCSVMHGHRPSAWSQTFSDASSSTSMLIVLMSLVESSMFVAFQAMLQNQEIAAGVTRWKERQNS